MADLHIPEGLFDSSQRLSKERQMDVNPGDQLRAEEQRLIRPDDGQEEPWRVDVPKQDDGTPQLHLPPSLQRQKYLNNLRKAVDGLDPLMARQALDVAAKTGINPNLALVNPEAFRKELEATDEWTSLSQARATMDTVADPMVMQAAQRDIPNLSESERMLVAMMQYGAAKQMKRMRENEAYAEYFEGWQEDPDLSAPAAIWGGLIEGIKGAGRWTNEYMGAMGEKMANGMVGYLTDIGYTREQALAYFEDGTPLPILDEYNGALPWWMQAPEGKPEYDGYRPNTVADDVAFMNDSWSIFQVERGLYKFAKEIERSNREGWLSAANPDSAYGQLYSPDDEFFDRLNRSGGFTQFAGGVGQGFSSLANMAFFSLFGSPELGIAVMYSQIAGADIEAGRKAGLDIDLNWRAANFNALLQTPMEALSFNRFMKVWQPQKLLTKRFAAYLESVLTETATEALQTIPEELADALRKADAESIWEVKQFLGDLFTVEMLKKMGYNGAIGGTVAALTGGVGMARSGFAYMRNSEQIDQIDALQEQIANMQDVGSSPAVLQRFAQELVKKGRLPENVFIPTAPIRALFQDRPAGELEKFIEQELGLSMAEFEDAEKTGAEVQVSGDRLGPLMGSEKGKALSPDIRMSAVEREAVEHVERIAASLEETGDIETAAEKAAVNALFQGELVDTKPFIERITADLQEKGGYTREQAVAYAMLIDANAHIWSATTGESVTSYYDTFGYRMEKTDFGKSLENVYNQYGQQLGISSWEDFVSFYNADNAFRSQVHGLLQLGGFENIPEGSDPVELARGVIQGLGLNPDEVFGAAEQLAVQGRQALVDAIGEDAVAAIEQTVGMAVDEFFATDPIQGAPEGENVAPAATGEAGQGTLFKVLSSRVPWAKNPKEDALAEVLTLDYEVTLADTKTLGKNMKTLMGYPNMRKLTGKGSKTPSVQAEAFIEHAVNNLLMIFDQVPQEVRDRSKLWYDGGNRIISAWASRYGISKMQGAGVIAVLSPQKDWYQNVTQAERILDVVSTKQDFEWTADMSATAKRIAGSDKAAMSETMNHTLGELLDRPDLAARWIRVFDETYNNRNYRILSPEGGTLESSTTKSGSDSTSAWGSFREIAKAVSILTDGRAENVHYQIGTKHKVRNFYNNLYDPTQADFVTIDTHAVAAALLRPLGGNSPEVMQNFGGAGSSSSAATDHRGTYPIYAEAYRRAAEARGVLPREMQSITWEAVRGLFENKNKKMADKANAIWERYKKGEIEQDQAQREIVEMAGGFTQPGWTKHGFNNKVGKTYVQKPGVAFEVAPSPDNQALTNLWNQQPLERQTDITREVAAVIVPKLFKELGVSGVMSDTLGGFLGATTPSLNLTLADETRSIEVAKALGYVLGQKGMVVAGAKPFKGGEANQALTLELPDGYGASEIAHLYERLWEIEHNGEKLVGGHTTIDGKMIILNFTELQSEELAAIIDSHLGGEFTVYVDPVYSTYIDEGEYGHGSDSQKRASGGSSAGTRLDDLRSEAADLLNESLRRRGNAVLFQRGQAGRSLSTGALEVTARYGQPRDGAASVLGIHYSGHPRAALSGAFYGTGLKGAEKRRIDASGDSRLSNRIHFYVDTGKGIVPEQGVGANCHAVYLDNLYDESADPLNIKSEIEHIVDQGDWMNALEQRVIDAGYDGILVPRAQGTQGVAVLIGPHDNVTVEPVEGWDRKPSDMKEAKLEVVPPGTIHPSKLVWAIPALVEKMVVEQGMNLPGNLDLETVKAMPRPRDAAMKALGVDPAMFAPQEAQATNTLFQGGDRAPVFFSRLTTFMESKLPPKAPATAILQTLESWKKKAPGFGSQKTTVRGKDVEIPGPLTEELQWSGLEDWLQEQGKRKVTKQEILDWMNENRLEIVEHHKEDIGFDPMDLEDLEFNDFEYEGDETYTYDLANGDIVSVFVEEGTWNNVYTVSINGKDISYDNHSWGEVIGAIVAHYDRNTNRAIYGPSYTGGETLYTFGGENYREIVFSAPGVNQGEATVERKPYKSVHWDESNPIAHVRFQDFRDADGMKVLFLEEIQSDAVKDVLDGRTSALPMTTSSRWMKMVMRRMIRYAAENGYSRVAWTTGKMQQDRYSLTKKVKSISVEDKSTALKSVAIEPTTGKTIFLDVNKSDGLVKRANGLPAAVGQKLHDVVGSGLAESILSSDGEASFAGGDLEVGGEGKAALYDKQMPAMFRQLIKPWGVKVGTTTIHVPGTDAMGAVSGNDVMEKMGIPEDERSAYWRNLEQEERDRLFEEYRAGGAQEVHSFDVTLDMVKDVLYVGQPLFQDKVDSPQGATSFEQDIRATIHFFEAKDVSTAGHEIYHVFRRVLQNMAMRDDAPAWVQKDWETACEFVGAQPGQPWTVEQEEKWAEAGERYLLEGKAPSEGLKGAFATFRRWLLNLYKTILGTRQNISPEMRQVFDRMLATEEEIGGAAANMQTQPLFSEQDLGDEAQAYVEAARKAKAASTAEVEATLEAERQKLLPAWRKEAAKFADEDEGQKRIASISDRGGLDEDTLKAAGLDEETITKLRSKHKGKKLVAKPGSGVDASIVADENGFDSVGEMVQFLLSRMSKANLQEMKMIELESKWRDSFDPEIEVLKEKYERLLELEAEILGKATNRQHVRTSTMKKVVRERTGQTKVGRIEMSELAALKSVIRREARAAREAYRAGRMDEAMKAKERQRRAIAELNEKWRAQREIAETKRKVKAIAKGKNIKHEYREQMLALVQQFGLGTKTMAPMEPVKMPSLMVFLRDFHTMFDAEVNKDADGNPVLSRDVPVADWIIEAGRKRSFTPQELTLDQLRDVHTAIKWLSFQGRNLGKLQSAHEAIEVQEVAEESASIMGKLKDVKVMSHRERQTQLGKVKGFARGMMADMRMTEFLLKMADGFKKGLDAMDGPLKKHIMDPIVAAREEELIQWERIQDRLRKVMVQLPKERFAIPDVVLPRDVSRAWEGLWDMEKVLAVALNMGNEGNRNALKKGYSRVDKDGNVIEWTDEDLNNIVKHLQPELWDVVEEVWRIVDSVFPNVQKAYRKINGVPLEKVEAQPFTAPNGRKLRGGYYPLVFDGEFSRKAAKQDEREILNSREAVFQSQSPRSGFTNKRRGGTLPPKLNLNVLYKHLWDSIHYSTHAVAVRDAYRLVTNRTFADTFTDKFGKDAYNQLVPWLRYIARPEREYGDSFEGFMNKLRQKSTIVVLGLNAKVAAKQFTSIMGTMNEVGIMNTLKGIGYCLTHRSAMLEQVDGMSAFMRARASNIDRELKSVLSTHWSSYRKTLKTPFGEVGWDDFHNFCFLGIRAMDAAATYPTWMAAYNKAMDDLQAAGLQDPALLAHKAAKYADDIVRQTQPSANPMDLAGFQRSSVSYKRLFSMFMTFTLKFWNRQAYHIRGLKEGNISSSEFAKHFWLEWIMPVVLIDLTLNFLGAGFDTDDWEGEGMFLDPLDFAGFWLSGIPFARNVVGSWKYFGSDVSDTPALNGLNAWAQLGYRTGSLAWDMLTGEDIEGKDYRNWARAFVESVGYVYGIPSAWAFRAYDGINQWVEGETNWPLRPIFGDPNPDN